jgi:hypothetical protein
MSAPTLADMVGQNLKGQQAAQHALHDLIHSTPSPDLLHERLQAVLVTGEAERLRSFMRVLQKRLEAAS